MVSGACVACTMFCVWTLCLSMCWCECVYVCQVRCSQLLRGLGRGTWKALVAICWTGTVFWFALGAFTRRAWISLVETSDAVCKNKNNQRPKLVLVMCDAGSPVVWWEWWRDLPARPCWKEAFPPGLLSSSVGLLLSTLRMNLKVSAVPWFYLKFKMFESES